MPLRAHQVAVLRAREACDESRELRLTRQMLLNELMANLERSRHLIHAALLICARLRQQ